MNTMNLLRMKFPFMSFLTDREIENLMSVVQTVSLGTSIKMEDILKYMNAETQATVVSC